MEIYAYPPITLPSPVMALAVDDTGTLWAGGMGGVASYAGGQWTPHISGLPITGVSGLVMVGDWLLAGGVEGLAVSGTRGAAWSYARVAGPVDTVTALAASPAFANDRAALAGTLGGGVLHTSDAGVNWAPVNDGLEDLEVMALAWLDATHALVGTVSGIYRSADGGRTWQAATGGAAGVVAALVALDANRALAALEEGGLLHSADGGMTWSALPSDLPADATPTALHQVGATLLLGTGEGLLRSVDGGRTWTQVTGGAILALTGGGPEIYAGTASGVVASADGGTNWTALPVPPIHDLRQMVVVKGAPVVAGRYSVVLRYVDESTGWEAVEGTPLPLSLLTVERDGLLYVSGPEGLFRSGDGGRIWSTVAEGVAGHVNQLAVRGDGFGWATSADHQRLLRTEDGGTTWQVGASPFGGLPVISLEAAPDQVMVATYDPRRQVAQLWRSTTDGTSWQRGAEVPMPWAAVATWHTPPLVGMGNVIFMQAEGGGWTRITLALEGLIRRILGDEARLLALTTGGLFISTDAAATWQRLEGLDVSPDQIMDFALAGGAVYLLLVDGLVYRVDL